MLEATNTTENQVDEIPRYQQMNGPPLQFKKVKGTPGLTADSGGQSHRDSLSASVSVRLKMPERCGHVCTQKAGQGGSTAPPITECWVEGTPGQTQITAVPGKLPTSSSVPPSQRQATMFKNSLTYKILPRNLSPLSNAGVFMKNHLRFWVTKDLKESPSVSRAFGEGLQRRAGCHLRNTVWRCENKHM